MRRLAAEAWVTVQLDKEALTRFITRHGKGALAELGFNMDEDAPSVTIDFRYADDDITEVVGIEIFQEDHERPKRVSQVSFPPTRGPVQ